MTPPRAECECCCEERKCAKMCVCGWGHRFCKTCVLKTMAIREIASNTDAPVIFMDCIFVPACTQKIAVIRKRRVVLNQNSMKGSKRLLDHPETMPANKRKRGPF